MTRAGAAFPANPALRVFVLAGLRWLARVLYPQAFPEDMRPIVRDFYTRCYHQAPSEARLDQLLPVAGAGSGGA